jgi:hypothetical protein
MADARNSCNSKELHCVAHSLAANMYSAMNLIRIGEVSSNNGEPIHASPQVTLFHRHSQDR